MSLYDQSIRGTERGADTVVQRLNRAGSQAEYNRAVRYMGGGTLPTSYPQYPTSAASASGPGPESSGGNRANDSAATVAEAFRSIIGGGGKPSLGVGRKIAGTPYNRVMHHELFNRNGGGSTSGRPTYMTGS